MEFEPDYGSLHSSVKMCANQGLRLGTCEDRTNSQSMGFMVRQAMFPTQSFALLEEREGVDGAYYFGGIYAGGVWGGSTGVASYFFFS